MFAFSCFVAELSLKQQQALGLVEKSCESGQNMWRPLLPNNNEKYYKLKTTVSYTQMKLCQIELLQGGWLGDGVGASAASFWHPP